MVKRNVKAKPVAVSPKPPHGAVEARLQELYVEHGKLTPDLVVAEARKPKSILHGYFNWDIEHAAMEHWRDRARTLIRSVRLVITTETTAVECVAYVRDPNSPADEQGYLQVDKVRTEADVARGVLVDEFSRAASALSRARELAAVFNMRKDVDDLIESVQATKRRVPGEDRVS
ncbi:MAG TPA: hypothetical protein VNA25_22360 [Phycisphaerae bacterium]|nr:hypothetical protein [Phycisphaerae bacterium]